ncbi:LOW QUALITY PROTEIN: E3 ubiquitin-protein ligase MSL2-like [Ptychodera flava]|uniref:LOW QUALITY PROTEIN: E3 ubiquitin-protein ligase MSL2-like n=1 Tax=Ptychodera flava TaxID=63121 RepID=UPI00396A3A1F
MNATSLYISTCRYVLQANVDDPTSWSDLYRLLPYLRQSLSCCVCTSLIVDPMGPTDSTCQHHVCRSCLGGKMRLRPSCSWCKDYNKFEENKQLAVLLPCFKKLCEFIADTPIAKNLAATTNGGFSNPLAILQEGMAIVNNRASGSHSTSLDLATAISALTAVPKRDANTALPRDETASVPVAAVAKKQTNVIDEAEDSPSECDDSAHNEVDDAMNNTLNTYSVSLSNSVSTKMKFKRKKNNERTSMSQETQKNKKRFKELDPDRPENLKLVVIGRKPKDGKRVERKGCRCGTGNMNISPGKYTCYSRRCPCYVGFKGCNQCRCRGCQNPYKEGTVKNKTKTKKIAETTDEDSDSEIDITDN